MLNQGYFKSAKLAHERAEAWDHLNDLLQVRGGGRGEMTLTMCCISVEGCDVGDA